MADKNVIAAYAQQSLQWHTLELPINTVLLLPTYLTHLISDTYTREYTLTMQPVPQQRSKRSAPNAISIDPLNITLGVELEFMILESYNKGQRPTRENNDATLYSFDLVSEAFSKPVQLTCSSCGDAHDFDPPLNLESKERIGSAPACWSLVSDKSIELKHRQKAKLRLNDCDVFGVEVTSRVLSANPARQVAESSADSNHTHTISYQDEITGILNTLSKALDTRLSGRQGRRLVTNDSCSLHVHVGNGSNGFPVQTIKDLLSICTAFERVIDGMHAASRIGGSVLALTPLDESSESEASNDMVADGSMFGGIYNKALTEHLMSNAYVTRRNDSNTPQLKATRTHYPSNQLGGGGTLKEAASSFHTMAFFEVIQQAPDIESLQEMLLLSSKTNVNIMHLVVKPGQMVSEERPYQRFNTIEFRQHAAIAEPREALAWIDFVQTLVKYAHGLSEEDAKAICEHVASNPHFGLADMFDMISVEQNTRGFYLSRTKETVETAINNARAEAEQSGAEDPLQATVLELLDERAKDHDPAAVSQVVSEKFKRGGYGQFSREFIDVYAPLLSEVEKEQLIIGWEAPPTPDWSSPLLSDESMS